MTISRNAKKRITWATKGEAQPVSNPVELGRRRQSGQSDFYSPTEYLAQVRDHSGRVIYSPRVDKMMGQRMANRLRGYRA